MWLADGFKNGWVTLLSLLLSNETPDQYGSDSYQGSKPTLSKYQIPFTPNKACFSYSGKSGICQTLVECSRFNNRLKYLNQSLCQLTQYSVGICCPIDDDESNSDPGDYAGLGMTYSRNTSINFPQSPTITTSDLNNACEIAIYEMEEREKLERDLVRKNIIAKKNSSVFFHARLFKTNERIYLLGRDASLVLLASISLVKRFTIEKEKVENVLTQYGVSNTIIKDTCPISNPCSDVNYPYRSYDGTCNNLLHQDWGSVGASLRRLIKPYYADGASVPRQAVSGLSLPSARLVSVTMHPDKLAYYSNYTLLLMQFGQFLDHDITHTPLTKGSAFTDVSCCEGGIYRSHDVLHPECFPIQIPDDDPFYSQFGQKCMDFVRSMPAIRQNCAFGPREQMNQVTSYIDGSAIYGSSVDVANLLRSFIRGTLKVTNVERDLLMPKNPSECTSADQNKFCFKAGDSRVNEQPQLAALQTVWLRQHNVIVKKLALLNPHWSDEILFQEGRRIVVAQIQHITYNEYLPLVLGREFMSIYKLLPQRSHYFEGYRDDIDATILNSFSTAAYRFGHSLVTDHFSMHERNGNLKKKLELDKVQFSPYVLYEKDGVEGLLRGLLRQSPRKLDRFFIQGLSQRLFAGGHPFGLDLVALNIQRGRDHGLPPYVEWRKHCELKPAIEWEDLLVDMDADVIANLQSVYENIEDIDLFVGGISEKPLNESLVGPTFFCILAKQFIRLKFGDRFFYENGPDEKYNREAIAFTPDQLQQIRKTSMARILCSNGKNMGLIQPLAFITANQMNERALCSRGSKIPFVSLRPWKENLKN